LLRDVASGRFAVVQPDDSGGSEPTTTSSGHFGGEEQFL